MKKIITCLAAIMFVTVSFAQEERSQQRQRREENILPTSQRPIAPLGVELLFAIQHHQLTRLIFLSFFDNSSCFHKLKPLNLKQTLGIDGTIFIYITIDFHFRQSIISRQKSL